MTLERDSAARSKRLRKRMIVTMEGMFWNVSIQHSTFSILNSTLHDQDKE